MKLSKIIKNIETIKVKGSKNINITGVFSHSKVVFPGSIFIAKKGHTSHGNYFIQNAIQNGASCIVLDMYNPFLSSVTQVVVNDPAKVEAKIAANFFENPSQHINMIGITGTCGKTSTSYFTRHLLKEEDPIGLIGSIETSTGLKNFRSLYTTPDAPTLMKILKEMKSGGCKNCVMEVSSHGLAQGRVKETSFDVVAFLNISHEHLDYHHTMEEYKDAKERLLIHRKKDSIVITSDNSLWARGIKKKIPEAISFGFSANADVRAKNIDVGQDTSIFELCIGDEVKKLELPVIGRFNIENALAASAIAYSLGISFDDITKRLLTLPSVPGRMEKVFNTLGKNIIVDYAHKVDALENVLMSIKENIHGRLFIVFGCGGERDKEKRPLMGALVDKYCDYAVLTNDNPRGEDPLTIIEEIKKGIKKLDHCIIQDRRKAVNHAVAIAKKGDTILLAGKGHEEEQEISGKRIFLSDRNLARDIEGVL